ncbi:MAG: monovalent cation:proton antiporter family protein [Bacteroidales bacterium]|nr:monovalent cation:proton antiporter family protein [Bacteroidales bacterium]
MLRFLSISLDFDYLPLMIVIGLAWLIPMLLTVLRIKRIPSVIVEILAGYFAGKYLLISINPESLKILEFLGLTGFIFLMFLGGLEIDMDQVIYSFPKKRSGRLNITKNPVLTAILIFLITLALAYGSAILLSRIVYINNYWYFSLIMVTTSVSIVFPVLKNRGESLTSYGQTLIISAAVADILSIILFTFTAFIITNGFRIEITYLLLLFLLFYLLYRVGNRFRKWPLLKKISFQLSHAVSQLSIRGSIFLLLVFVVISQFISTEAILLGAFLCGMLLSLFLHKGRSLLLLKLDGLGYGFFIPIFFIMVGVKFDPASLKEFEMTLIPFLAALFLLLFAIKVIPSLILVRQFGLRMALSGGFLLSSRLSLIIAASAIGLNLGIISPGINASFVLMAIITCFLGPLLYNSIKPHEKYPMGTTIIVGGSSKGVLLARRLNMQGKSSVIVENNEERFKALSSRGLKAILSDGLDPATYTTVQLTNSNYVIVDTGSAEMNITICELLRKELNHDRIISLANKSGIERQLRKLDVETVDATRVMATTIESLILRPATYHALIETFENFTLEEITVTNPSLDGRKVKEIAFHRDVILIMARSSNNVFIPHGETYLRTGNVLYVLGTDTALTRTREYLR